MPTYQVCRSPTVCKYSIKLCPILVSFNPEAIMIIIEAQCMKSRHW